MSNVAISVEGLGKRYRIGAGPAEPYGNIRESLVRAAGAPLRRLRGGASGGGAMRDAWALKDVSFEVKHGEAVGIIGRNGAGKSTLLKVLSRITEPTTGQAVVHGRVGSLLEVGTGFHPELSGRENIYLNGAVMGMSRADIKRRFDEIVDFAGVETYLDTPVKRYSSGMYMRLAFAVAAHMEPEVLVVDEVLAVGDAEFQKKCLGKMEHIAHQGRTVLFVSHNMAALENVCDRAVLLQAGRVSCVDQVKQTIEAYLDRTRSDAAATTFLDSQTNRTGDGRIRLTSFHVEDSLRNKINVVQCGQDIALVFGYSCADSGSLGNVTVGFGIHSNTGERLAVLYTSYTNHDFASVPPTGECRCHISRFPFAPGRYPILPRVEINGIEADFPRDGAGHIDVESGDFFGTGRMIGDRGLAPFLLGADWTVIGTDACPANKAGAIENAGHRTVQASQSTSGMQY